MTDLNVPSGPTRKWALTFCVLLSCFGSISASEFPPTCPTDSQSGAIPFIHYFQTLQIQGDDAVMFRPPYAMDVVVEAGYDTEGKLTCASPLAGFSVYWPYAIRALSMRPPRSDAPKLIVIFEDPGQHELFNELKDKLLKATRCGPATHTDILLQLGRVLLIQPNDSVADARTCFELATQRSADSVAAHYGGAIAEARFKQSESAMSLYERVMSERPQFYEAQIQLARLYGNTGHLDKQESLLNGLSKTDVPLPVRLAVSRDLVHFYDLRGKDSEAAAAKQYWITGSQQLQNMYPPLVEDFLLAQENQDLGLRLEAQKRYREAASHYHEAAEIALRPGSKVSEAERFVSGMGESRSLTHMGDLESATALCSAWKTRLHTLGSDLENTHWQGEQLANARWELSCGDFDKGLRMIRDLTELYVRNHKEGDPYRLAAPYRVLETAYRASGETALAKLARATADRILAERNSQIIRQILKEAEPLYRGNRPPKGARLNLHQRFDPT
jgi:tetratricopeptide (TPR) repeat protein